MCVCRRFLLFNFIMSTFSFFFLSFLHKCFQTHIASTAATASTNRDRIMRRVKKVVTMLVHKKQQQNQNKNPSSPKDPEASVSGAPGGLSGTPGGLFKVAMATQAAALPAKKLPPDSDAAVATSKPPRSNLFKTVMAPVLPAKKLSKKPVKKPVKKLQPVKTSPIKVKPSKEAPTDDT